MGIRLVHTHEDGKMCYRISKDIYTRRLRKSAIHLLSGQLVPIAYNIYTGHWYAYDPSTGKVIASFTRTFYETYLQLYKVADLIEDEDCNMYANQAPKFALSDR